MILSEEPRKKSPVTPPGINPETVRLVAQCLNHYATPAPPPRFLIIHFNIIIHLLLGLLICLFPSVVPTKFLYAPSHSWTHATYPAHLILPYLITRILPGVEWKALRSTLCWLIHSPTNLPLLASYFRKLSSCLSPLKWGTKFHAHIENRQN